MNVLTLKVQIRKVRYKLSWLYNSVLVVENISILRCIDIQGVQKHANRKAYPVFSLQLLCCRFSQSWKRSACPGMVVLEGL